MFHLGWLELGNEKNGVMINLLDEEDPVRVLYHLHLPIDRGELFYLCPLAVRNREQKIIIVVIVLPLPLPCCFFPGALLEPRGGPSPFFFSAERGGHGEPTAGAKQRPRGDTGSLFDR
jgi:hypothetical protein